VAALFGMSRWANMGDVYLSKVTEPEKEEEEDADSKAVGTWLESAILDWFDNHLGVTTERHLRFESGVYAANTDGCIIGPGRRTARVEAVVEAKVSSEVHRWGPSGSDEVPDEYVLQVHHQMYCSEAEKAYIVVLLTGFGTEFRVYEIERNEAIVDAILKRGELFWTYVDTRTPPPETPRLESVKNIARVPEKTVQVDRTAVDAYKQHHEEFLEMQRVDRELYAAMLLQLDDAEVGEFDGGRVEFFSSPRKGYEVKPTTVRRLKVVYTE